jgi:hypothetical protein
MTTPSKIAASFLLLSIGAHAADPIGLTSLDKGMVGTRTRVMTLGTVHLELLTPPPKTGALDALLDKLAAFNPQIITIEAISGEQCDLAARNPSVYGADYCADATAARSATGLDIPAAIAEVNKVLKAWPAQPTPAQRRRLAALFLAANDQASAYVQWLQLDAAERHAGDSLDDALVQSLRQLGSHYNENYQIGATLAARLGLTRVYAVDDHTGDNITVDDEKAFGQAVQASWDKEKATQQASLDRQKKLEASADLLPLYRFINQPNELRNAARINVRTAMQSTSPQRYPQIWVAGWETRNLRMIANVHATFRERPGARVLAIVGATHKPWFDGWMRQMQGVDVADVEQVLK